MVDPEESESPHPELRNPTHVTRAVVYKGGIAAGELLRERNSVVFRYLVDYLDGAGRSVASTLPKSRNEYRTRGGAVPAFFAGLLPEGRRLEVLPRSLKTSPDDEYSMLLAVGHDCIGDIQVVADDADPDEKMPSPSLDRPQDVSFDEILESSLSQGFLSRDKSIPGVQNKLSDSMISLPVGKGIGGAILKLNPSGHPLVVENEAFVLDMGRAAGLGVPIATVVRDRNGRSGLVVERFDRERSKNGTVRRIAQEDAVQLASRLPADKYRMNTKEVFEVVLNIATAKPVTAEKLLRQYAFSYVVGNGDLHAKNISVYFEPDGIWSLTPAYDLVSTLPYGDDRMAVDFDGRDRNLRGSTFVNFGSRYHLNERVVRRMIDEVTVGVTPLVESLDDIGFAEKKTEYMKREMHRRITQLRDIS